MHRRVQVLFAVVSAVAACAAAEPAAKVAPGIPPADVDAVLRKAEDWLKAGNGFSPEHRIVAEQTAHMARTLREGKSFVDMMGAGLVKSSRTTFLCSRGGGFFVFEMSADQCKRQGVHALTAAFRTAPDGDIYRRRPECAVAALKLDKPGPLPANEKLAGRLAFAAGGIDRLRRDLRLERFGVRLLVMPGGPVIQYQAYLSEFLTDAGEMTFAFDPPAEGWPVRVTAVFLDVVTFPEAGAIAGGVVVSNTVASMVEFTAPRPSGKPPGP